MSMFLLTAGSHETVFEALGRMFFPENSGAKVCLWYIHVHVSLPRTGPSEKFLGYVLLKHAETLISCKSLRENLVKSLLTSPSRDPALRSWRSPALVFVWFWNAHSRFFCETLVVFLRPIYKVGTVASLAIMSNLMCSCSMSIAACIWYSDPLPPTLFGASFRCIFSPPYNVANPRSSSYPNHVPSIEQIILVGHSSKIWCKNNFGHLMS